MHEVYARTPIDLHRSKEISSDTLNDPIAKELEKKRKLASSTTSLSSFIPLAFVEFSLHCLDLETARIDPKVYALRYRRM